MNNIWFNTNVKKIEAVKRKLIEYDYAGSYGGSLNLMEINNIIDGFIIEMTKLHKENDQLKIALTEANKKEPSDGSA